MVIDRTQPDWASNDSSSHSRLLAPDAEVTDGSRFGKSLTRDSPDERPCVAISHTRCPWMGPNVQCDRVTSAGAGYE